MPLNKAWVCCNQDPLDFHLCVLSKISILVRDWGLLPGQSAAMKDFQSSGKKQFGFSLLTEAYVDL